MFLAAPVVSQVSGPYQCSTAMLDTGLYGPDSSSVLANPYPGAAMSSWNFNSEQPVCVSQVAKGIICSYIIVTILFFFLMIILCCNVN